MTKTIKLSPAMEAAMWNMYWCEKNGMSARVAENTRIALLNRRLVTGTRGESILPRKISEAGHAWIAEQIDIAHDEAAADIRQLTDESDQRMRWYRKHRNCTHYLSLAATVNCDHANALRANIGLSRSGSEQDRAIREAQRADCVAVSLPAILDDWTEALLEDIDRGGKAWKGMPLTRI